MANVEMF